MARKKGGPPIYKRGARYWLDGRRWGKPRGVALKHEGETRATTDEAEALQLAGDFIQAWEAERMHVRLTGRPVAPTLDAAVTSALEDKERNGKSSAWLAQSALMLSRAIEHFGETRRIDDIGTTDVREWIDVLRTMRGPGERQFSAGTIRHHLNSFSHVFTVAIEAGALPPGFNPVSILRDKPRGKPGQTPWLGIPEATLLFEAAQQWRPERPDQANACAPDLLRLFLLTGCRESELTGLLVADVSLTHGTIRVEPNRFRTLKSEKSTRTIPLWPQAREIIARALRRAAKDKRKSADLLFPSEQTGNIISDLRTTFDSIARLAGLSERLARTRPIRVTYTAARLQTLDGGEPVSPYTVARELGHADLSMVQNVYGRLGRIRHRAEVVEYRAAAVLDILARRADDEATDDARARLEEEVDDFRAKIKAIQERSAKLRIVA